ncbi:MAG: hypothetical protein QOK40_324, partial [Miltoncostaeaceae bacterium]|nr:hypothetical protein [Miltoncostaeaceae bacterium]
SRVAAFRANPRRDLIAQSAAATEQLAAVRLLAGEAAKNTQWAKFSQVVYQAGKHGAADGRNRAKLAEIERVATMADETVASATGALALLVTPDGSGTSPLQRAEAYAASKTACIVILEPGCAAAESVYEDIKVKRDRGMHTGSTTFSYLILDDGGAVRAAGIAHGHVAALSKVGVPHVAWSDEEPTDDPIRRLLTGNGSS